LGGKPNNTAVYRTGQRNFGAARLTIPCQLEGDHPD
jgi:hypothetical protein